MNGQNYNNNQPKIKCVFYLSINFKYVCKNQPINRRKGINRDRETKDNASKTRT